MNVPPSPKDWWDRAQIVFVALVPIVLGVSGYYINETLKEREVRTQYVEIAAGILAGKPNPDSRAMRTWAITVLEKYSDIPVGQDVKDELEKTALPEPNYLTTQSGQPITLDDGSRIIISPSKGK